MLEHWLKHYGNIFGLENIIIFDNESNDAQTKEILNRYNDKVGIIINYSSAGGDHNIVHNPRYFKEFYERIATVCDYFALLDADEFLISFQGDSVLTGSALFNELIRASKVAGSNKAIMFFWLMALGSDNKFAIPYDNARFLQLARSGKFFAPARKLGQVVMSHNHSCPVSLVSKYNPSNLWLLHYQNYNRDRRIKVNFEKIMARKMFKDGISISMVMNDPNMDMLIDNANRTAVSHMTEICRLVHVENGPVNERAVEQGTMAVSSTGSVQFDNVKSEAAFTDWVAGFHKGLFYRYMKSGMARELRRQRMISYGLFCTVTKLQSGFLKVSLVDLFCNDIEYLDVCYGKNTVMSFELLFHSNKVTITVDLRGIMSKTGRLNIKDRYVFKYRRTASIIHRMHYHDVVEFI